MSICVEQSLEFIHVHWANVLVQDASSQAVGPKMYRSLCMLWKFIHGRHNCLLSAEQILPGGSHDINLFNMTSFVLHQLSLQHLHFKKQTVTRFQSMMNKSAVSSAMQCINHIHRPVFWSLLSNQIVDFAFVQENIGQTNIMTIVYYSTASQQDCSHCLNPALLHAFLYKYTRWPWDCDKQDRILLEFKQNSCFRPFTRLVWCWWHLKMTANPYQHMRLLWSKMSFMHSTVTTVIRRLHLKLVCFVQSTRIDR